MVVMPLYKCSQCERDELPLDRMKITSRDLNRHGRVRAYWCADCAKQKQAGYDDKRRDQMRAYSREWYQRKRREDLEGLRAIERERKRRQLATPEGRAKANATARRYYSRIRKDPVRWARYLESARICYRLRQERAGRDLADIHGHSDVTMPPDKQPMLPAGPLADAIASLIQTGSEEIAAEALGIDVRQFFAWREGEIKSVTFNVADRVLTNAGLLPWQVFDAETCERIGYAVQ